MECPAFEEQRQRLLGPVMDDIETFCRDNNLQELEPEELWQACLGGLRSQDPRLLQKFATLWLRKRPEPQQHEELEVELPTPPHDHAEETLSEETRYDAITHNNTNNNIIFDMQLQEAREQIEDSERDSRQDQLSNGRSAGYSTDTAGQEVAHQLDMEYDPRTDPLFAETDSSTSAIVGGNTEEESEVTSSTTADDSPVDPSMPLWQRVTQFVDQVLTKHFSNIHIYMRRFDDAPGRPRANAPFRVRQHFGTGPTARLSVVRQHILRAVDHLQSADGLVAMGDSVASGSGTRALSSRQGVG
jgi:hypothetical protein